MSGFQKLPTIDEVKSHDPRWISDMQLAQQLFAFQQNNSPVYQQAEKAQAQKAENENQGMFGWLMGHLKSE